MAPLLVVLHGLDPDRSAVLTAHLAEATVRIPRSAEELAAELAGATAGTVLVAAVRDERGWQRLQLIRDALPDLAIVASPVTSGRGVRWADRPGLADEAVPAAAPVSVLVSTVRRLAGLPEEGVGGGPLGERTWAVVGLAGGVGATTIAGLLACRSAIQVPTTAVDLDRRHGALGAALRAETRYTTEDLVTDELVGAEPDRLEEAVLASRMRVAPGLDLLAGADDGLPAEVATDSAWLAAVARAAAAPGRALVVDLGDLPRRAYGVLDGFAEVVLVASHDIRCARRLPLACAEVAERAPSARVRIVLNGVAPAVDPAPAELEPLIGRSWDAVVPDLAAVRAAHNDAIGDGLRTLAANPPRELASALSVLTGSGVASTLRRRFRRSGTGRAMRRSS